MAASALDAQEGEAGGRSHTPWHKHDWNAILAGTGEADRYFARSGLIRKDRLSTFVAPEHHPPTAVLRSFEELRKALEALGALDGTVGQDPAVCFVLKKAHSSNAFGIRFLTGADARGVLGPATGAADGLGPAPLACSRALGLSAVAAGFAAVAIACCCKSSTTLKRFTLPVAMLTATLGVAMLGHAGVAKKATDPDTPQFAVQSEAQRTLIKDLSQLLQPNVSEGGEQTTVWVLQRHIQPWLHEGRKFHLRVLLLCVGDLRAYVHEDVRMLLATEPFRQGEQDGTQLLALVTNMGASRQSPEYCEQAQNLPLAALGEDMARQVFGEVVEVLGATVARVRAAGRRHFFTTPNCWELFGADFLVAAESARPVLLEINPSPSLAMYGSGPDVREQLCGSNPLNGVLPSWHAAPLSHQ